jgi:PIN domain nuclease of toxin-antitoxin system
MKLLLDTHAFLWLDAGSDQIPARVVEVIEANENSVYLSVASLWEIQIKAASGKLQLERPLAEVIRQQISVGFHILPVMARHVLALQELPGHHRDPFDRLLIAQAIRDDLTLISCDPQIGRYSVPTLW